MWFGKVFIIIINSSSPDDLFTYLEVSTLKPLLKLIFRAGCKWTDCTDQGSQTPAPWTRTADKPHMWSTATKFSTMVQQLTCLQTHRHTEGPGIFFFLVILALSNNSFKNKAHLFLATSVLLPWNLTFHCLIKKCLNFSLLNYFRELMDSWWRGLIILVAISCVVVRLGLFQLGKKD